MRLRMLAAARREGQEAARWYEGRRAGLGHEFLDTLAQALESIEAEPLKYARWETIRTRREVRCCQLSGFPYLVIYEIRTDEIVVLAVAHGHRRPNYWSRRRG